MLRSALPAVLALAALAACNGDGTSPEPVADVQLTAPAAALAVGDTARLAVHAATAAGGDVAPSRLTWTSSDEHVAKVSGSGVVTAVAVGTAQVTASRDGKSASVPVAVRARVARIVIDDTVRLAWGVPRDREGVASLLDASGNVQPAAIAAWSFSDTSVVRFESGRLVGRKLSRASVTVSADGVSETRPVVVAPLASVALSSAAAALLVGDSAVRLRGEAGIDPYTGLPFALSGLTWTTSDASVATVDSTGLVTPLAPGRTTIRATAPGGAQDSAVVEVVRYAPALRFAQAWRSASSCGLTTDARVFCWGGSKGFDALTPGHVVTACQGFEQHGGQMYAVSWDCQRAPLEVGAGTHWTSLAVGPTQACAVAQGGDAYCWAGKHSSPARLSVPRPLTAIAGYTSFCALDDQGTPYCWGGPVGPAAPTALATPAPLVSVAVSDTHACGLDAAGAAYCWGGNGLGELGTGTTTDQAAPVAVSGGVRFRQVAAGHGFTCGLDTGGKVYCWGKPLDGSSAVVTAPAPLAAVAGQTFTALSSACAVRADGSGYCWSEVPAGDVHGPVPFTGVSTGWYGTFFIGSDGAPYALGLTGTGAANFTRVPTGG